MKPNCYTNARWQALGSDCELVIYDRRAARHSPAAAAVIERTRDFENRFSRFKPTSELTRFNQAPAGKFKASNELVALLRLSQQIYQATNGFFDPTIVDSLISYGYQSADNIWPISTETAAPISQPLHPFSELRIEDNNTVIKPAGLRLDLGGIGKSFLLALLAKNQLSQHPNYYLSLGGDIIVKGTDGQHDGWRVIIDHSMTPERRQPYQTIVSNGTLCTTGTARRRGIAGKTRWHHIIDPISRASLKTPLVAVTVQGTDPVWTEQVARLALKEADRLSQAWLTHQNCQAIWFTNKTGTTKHYHA